MLQYNFLYLFSVVDSAIRYSEPPPPPPDSTTFSVAPIHGDDDTDMGGLKPLNRQKLDLSTTTNNGRSDLLAAIRASGGARGAGLKKAEELTEEENKEVNEAGDGVRKGLLSKALIHNRSKGDEGRHQLGVDSTRGRSADPQ